MFVEIRKRMEKRGLDKTMMLGMVSDLWPDKEQVTFWKEVSGEMPWAISAHGCPTGNGIVQVQPQFSWDGR